MKLSARARYAVRLMVELLRNGGVDGPVQLSEIARLTGISRSFLEQLAIALKNHGLLYGICGRKGGYVIARPADEITLRHIIVAAVTNNYADISGRAATVLHDLSCRSWNDNTDQVQGLVLSVTGSGITIDRCHENRSVTCCAPATESP